MKGAPVREIDGEVVTVVGAKKSEEQKVTARSF